MPIRLRLTLLYSAILALTLLAFGALVYTTVARVTLEVVETTLADEAKRLVDGKTLGRSGIVLPVSRFGAPETLVQVRAVDGSLVDRTANLGDATLPLDRAGADAVRAGQPWTAEATVEGEHLLVYSTPVTLGDRAVGTLQVARSLAEHDLALSTLRSILLAGSGVVLLFAFGAGWLLARAALRPIDAIAQAAEEIGEQRDFGRRVAHRGPPDEVGRLATTFDAMLERLEGAYRRMAEALAAQRRFVADASHELRTPLTTLRGNLALLERDPPISEADRAAVVSDMVAENERLIRLVNDLLGLARAGSGRALRPEPLELNALADDLARQARLLGPDHRVLADVPPGLAVSADRDALKQVLLILLDNALKHTPAGGLVALEGWEDGDGVVVSVRDSGPGIPAEQLPHLTERFYRGDPARSGEGAGLGLAIARTLAEAMGADFRAQSELGRGSSFSLSLPTADPESLRPPATPAAGYAA